MSILQRKQWLAEEVYRQRDLSIKLMSDENFFLLKQAKCQNRVDTGFEAYNYNLIASPKYQRLFDLASAKFRYYNKNYEDVVTMTLLG